MNAPVFQIDFKVVREDLEVVDRDILADNPDGFIRNCSVDEKIAVMKATHRCPTHCWVKPEALLYLELSEELNYPGSP